MPSEASDDQAMNLDFADHSQWSLWFRLCAHTLLRGSHIFSAVELCDESPDYEPLGFVDVWKGNYHGDQLWIKAIRIPSITRLKGITRVRGSFLNQS